MTLEAIRNDISALLRARGGVMVPDFDVIAPLVHAAVLQVANDAIVLKLLTTNTNHHLMRSLGGGYYVRHPDRAVRPMDEVDVEDALGFALANLVAAKLSRDDNDRRYFEFEAMSIIKSNNFNIYNTEDLDGL